MVVIDYKTGSSLRYGGRSGVYDGGRRLQHVLYAEAARRLFDAADQGNFAWFTGVILQIFDVSDMHDPKLIHKLELHSISGQISHLRVHGCADTHS